MPRSPQWMDLYQIRFRGSSRGRNQLCGILLQSAHEFWFCEGSKFAISRWLGRSPLTQCWRYRAACDNRHYNAEQQKVHNSQLLRIIFVDFDRNYENFNDCDIPPVPSISLSDISNIRTRRRLYRHLPALRSEASRVSRYLWTPQGQKLGVGCPDTNGLTPMQSIILAESRDYRFFYSGVRDWEKGSGIATPTYTCPLL